jgi:tetratricopeptide (TPR) repeat protein
MANDMTTLISQAWRYQREGRATAAVAEYERILKQDADDLDALYGMGLAQRDDHQKGKATEYFQRALDLVESAAAARRPVSSGEERVANNTPEDDRYMMLGRMIKQRLMELGNAK